MNKLHLHFVEKILAMKVRRVIEKADKQSFESYSGQGELKILVIGYSGKRNIGAEVRASEIIKQIKAMDLNVKLKFGVLTFCPEESRPFYATDVDMVPMNAIFFKSLGKACSDYHIGILAEGSCLTSVTSNMSALFFICAAGILKKQRKLCLGYGVEAGPLPKALIKMARNYCDKVSYIARTTYAKKIFENYGLKAAVGTDSAWSIEGIDIEWARNELIYKYGWDGITPLVGISAMNAFIRPIRPNMINFLKGKLFNSWENHYDSIYFYIINPERLNKYHTYLSAIVESVLYLKKIAKICPVLVEMEPMDEICLNDIERKLGFSCPRIKAHTYNGIEFTSFLSLLSLLISTRYHAHVLSMPFQVPCIAISKDQRLSVIFEENGLSEYCLSTEDSKLSIKLTTVIEKIWKKKEEVQGALKKSYHHYRMLHTEMGNQVKDIMNAFLAEKGL